MDDRRLTLSIDDVAAILGISRASSTGWSPVESCRASGSAGGSSFQGGRSTTW